MRELDQLLRNRRRTLRIRARAQIVQRGGGNAAQTDPVVLVKVLILGGDERVLQRFRDKIDRGPRARPHAGQRAHCVALRIQHDRRLRRRIDLIQIQLLPMGDIELPDQQPDQRNAEAEKRDFDFFAHAVHRPF